ncbi:MAG TPA: HlyD family type I secretion periplasmic adaptor subunit [Zeimonas sp.]
MAAVPDPVAPAEAAPVLNVDDARVRRWGWLVLLVGLGGFFLWAALAPLDQGVPVSGTVLVSGNRKTVQPLQGGLVEAILVREGDRVKSGQPVVRLDSTRAKSELEIAKVQRLAARSAEARLIAEQLGRSSIALPAELQSHATDPRVAQAIALQTQLFHSRRANLANEIAAMREAIAGHESSVAGLERSMKARALQKQLLETEIAHQRDLAEEGYLPRNRVSEQRRLLAQLDAQIAEDAGNIGRLRNSVAELRLRVAQRQQEYQQDVGSQLASTQREADALDERIRALEFELANTVIRSPADGIVVGLNVFTEGGVVQSGAPLMDVVPEHEPLRIDAQVPPSLIDRVHPDLPVELMFTSFHQAKTPHIPGQVQLVGADALHDPKTGLPYYRAQIEVTPEGMRMLEAQSHHVRPGMQVEALIRTGERTMLNYLMKPLLDRMQPALTEQ